MVTQGPAPGPLGLQQPRSQCGTQPVRVQLRVGPRLAQGLHRGCKGRAWVREVPVEAPVEWPALRQWPGWPWLRRRMSSDCWRPQGCRHEVRCMGLECEHACAQFLSLVWACLV